MDTLEQLIRKLIFVKGLGITKKWRVIKTAVRVGIYDFTATEIIRIAGYSKYSGLVATSWKELTPERIAEAIGGQSLILYTDPGYPELLQKIPDPPLGLFYVGDRDLLQHPLIAFVGARDADDYGRKIVDAFVPSLVQENYTIISGLAKGIDSYSHHAAIQAEGHTIAVVGTGVDVCYPREVYPIYSEMRENQLIISEYPAGTTPKKYHFPMRNRIIAGLSTGLCVIEAKERSGSLITAQQALDYGREVFSFPGEVLSGRSNGCHRLIQDGAKCVIDLKDILEELPVFA